MTIDNVTLEWIDADLRSDGCEDSLFYSGGYGHDTIVLVSKGDRKIEVCVDGEVDMIAYTKNGEKYEELGRIRSCSDLDEFGIRTDDDIVGLPYVEDQRDLYGPNKAGYYFNVIHNSWFDLYSEDGEHLDAVCHSLTEAIEQATEIINDDNDELWRNADV